MVQDENAASASTNGADMATFHLKGAAELVLDLCTHKVRSLF